MTEFMTAEWSPLGEKFYRKFELYRMTWSDHMNISEYEIAGSTYGGPIASTRKAMHMVRADSKQIVTIFNAAGCRLHEFRWQEGGQLMRIGWTASEHLMCVQDDGVAIMYDIFGNVEKKFDMGEDAMDLKITDCKIFNSYNDSGIIVMTTAYRFWIKGDVTRNNSPRRLADVPGLGAPPSSWSPVAIGGNICALVAKDDQLFLIDQLGQCQPQQIDISNPDVISYTEMAVSMNNKYIALFTATGFLWIGSADLQKCFCEFDTKNTSRPTQLVWCGAGAVMLYWEGQDLLLVGPDKDWITFPCDSSACIIPEVDGVRIVSNDLHELIQRVPEVTVQIFQIGSIAPGAYLFEAERKFKQQNKEANDYIDSIADQMMLAVEQCIEAAGNEYEPAKQKDLLRAASFGKCFVNTSSPDQFKDMCQIIRVLNGVREYTIGIPLTMKQYNMMGIDTLIDKLVYRRQYLIARKMCQYLKLKDKEVSILAHWACYKVENSKDPDHRTAAVIQEKLGDNSGVSYSEIASRAIERGKTNLAIMLLDHETKAANQIPLLMKIEKFEVALKKAIDSGDSNLVYQVIYELKDRLPTVSDFWMEIRKSPTALTLLMKYYDSENPHLLEDLYVQEDRHLDVANCRVAAALDEREIHTRKQYLQEAQRKYKEAHDEWAAKMTEDEFRLLEKQQQFEAQNIQCMNKSLHDTIHILIVSGNMKIADQMKKDFTVPERRFWWLKANALAESSNWFELENFSKSKKNSPIGYRPFVEACAKWGNKAEAAKYLARVSPDEKVKCLISIGEMEQAADYAYNDRHSEDELNLVLQQCTMADRTVFDRIQRYKMQLNS